MRARGDSASKLWSACVIARLAPECRLAATWPGKDGAGTTLRPRGTRLTSPNIGPRAGTVIEVAAVSLLTVLACSVARERGLDTRLFLFLNGWRGLPDAVWEALGIAGLGLTALVVFTIRAQLHPPVVATLPWMLLVGGGLTQAMKHAMPEPRPAAAIASAQLHVVGPTLFQRSMPSGHAMTATACVCILFLVGGPFWRRPAVVVGSIALAAAIGLARVVSGVHWPTDVLAGAALGCATGTVSVHLGNVTQTERWLATAPGRWLLGATQLGAGIAMATDQGYGRTLPIQWVLATLAVWAGVRTLSEQPQWGRLRRRPAAEART